MRLLGLLLAVAAFGQEFSVTDTHGRKVPVTPGDGRVTVVMFLSAICPVSNSYSARINDLYRDYAPKGVRFVFVNSNENEPAAAVEEHARRAGFAFPVYKDTGGVVADRFGAQYTPDSLVFDGAGRVRYHGRIDDAQNPARVRSHSLRLAIDAVLAGREVAQPETKAFGCTIKRARRAS
jgi:cytochrome oxidase Cu insertion factor (SCO1/SenC/PrrC family)